MYETISCILLSEGNSELNNVTEIKYGELMDVIDSLIFTGLYNGYLDFI